MKIPSEIIAAGIGLLTAIVSLITAIINRKKTEENKNTIAKRVKRIALLSILAGIAFVFLKNAFPPRLARHLAPFVFGVLGICAIYQLMGIVVALWLKLWR